MLREDMVACSRLISRALTLLEYDVKEPAIEALTDAQDLLERAPDEQRRKWRERKQRSRESQDVTVTSPVVTVIPRDSVVEEVVVEEVLKGVQGEMEPPAFIKPNVAQFVDEVIGHFNRITGSRYSTGPKRNKAHSRLIGARLKQEADLAAGDFAKAVKRTEMLIRLYHQKWANDAKQAQYLRPATLFTEDKWADRMEETRQWTQSQNGGMR